MKQRDRNRERNMREREDELILSSAGDSRGSTLTKKQHGASKTIRQLVLAEAMTSGHRRVVLRGMQAGWAQSREKTTTTRHFLPAWPSSDRRELQEAPMADSSQAPLMIGNRYHEERIVETNPTAVVAQQTGKVAVRGGSVKSGRSE